MSGEALSARLINQTVFDEIKWSPTIEGKVYPSVVINVQAGHLLIPATHIAKMIIGTSVNAEGRSHFENARRGVADLKTVGRIVDYREVSDAWGCPCSHA